MANFKLLYFQKYLTNFQNINCSEFLKTYILILIRYESQQSSFKKHPDHPTAGKNGTLNTQSCKHVLKSNLPYKLTKSKGYFTHDINGGGDNMYTADNIFQMIEV